MPETLTFSVVNWKESDAECTFTVVNSGFGYTHSCRINTTILPLDYLF